MRVPDIRGYLRYWWHMVQSDKSNLMEREGVIWGSTDMPSKICVEVSNISSLGKREYMSNFGFG